MSVYVLILGLAAVGALAGVLAGLLGIGGGIIIVPALFTLFSVLEVDAGVRMPLAVGTSLSTIIVTTTISARAHYRRGAVDMALLRAWAPWILLGVIVGLLVAGFAPQGVMLLVFATVALVVAGYMALAPEGVRVADDLPRGPGRWLMASLIGGISSIMGIGGGTLSVPTLTLWNYPVRRAVGTGAALGMLIAVPGTLGMMIAGWERAGLPAGSLGFVNVLGFAVLVPVTSAMAPVGARLAHRIPPRWLRRAFAAFLLITAFRMYADWFALV